MCLGTTSAAVQRRFCSLLTKQLLSDAEDAVEIHHFKILVNLHTLNMANQPASADLDLLP